ncbi:MAG TPA: hypothetical protein DD381_06360 [Lentisphaeria bacterium]|nr:hypothetical protein [Lentisphaeria bacterium]
MGAVWYCASGSQTILTDTYSSLVVKYGGTKTLGGTVTVNNALNVYAGSTLAVGANTLTVNGTSNIIGTLTIGTGTIDANSKFNATGGTVTFTGAGNLSLGGATITSLGTLTDNSMGTVWYDRAGSQTINAAGIIYNNITAAGSGTKTFNGGLSQYRGTYSVAAGVSVVNPPLHAMLPITLLALPFARRVRKGSEEVLSSLGKGISAKLHKHDLFKTEIDHLIEAIA